MTVVEVYILCRYKNYFTCGCSSSYEKMFKLIRDGASVEVIAGIIWCNSDENAQLEVITQQLIEMQNEAERITQEMDKIFNKNNAIK